jgi:hypothetical protein
MTFAESLAESRADTHPETKTETKAKAHGEVVLMVGTVKGAFFIWSDAARTNWRIDGPHFPGESVYALALDQRNGRHRLLAGTRSFHWGSVVRWSDDFGQSWTAPDRQNVKFPAGLGVSLVQV